MFRTRCESNAREAETKLILLRGLERAARQGLDGSPEAKQHHDKAVKACKEAALHLEDCLIAIPLRDQN